MLTSETKTRMTLTGRLSAERGNRKALRKGCDSSQAWGEYTPNVERVEAECNVVVRRASGRAPGQASGWASGGWRIGPFGAPGCLCTALFRRETTFRRQRAAAARPLRGIRRTHSCGAATVTPPHAVGEYARSEIGGPAPLPRRPPARGIRRSIRIRFERRAPARRQIAEAHQHPVGEPPDHTSLEGDGRARARRAGA